MTSVRNVVDVDEDEFLIESRLWTRELAVMMAKEEDIEKLTDLHWKVIQDMRDHYKEFAAPPTVREINDENKLFDVADLFPSVLVAWRIAGLPNPGEEAKAYMANIAEQADDKE